MLQKKTSVFFLRPLTLEVSQLFKMQPKRESVEIDGYYPFGEVEVWSGDKREREMEGALRILLSHPLERQYKHKVWFYVVLLSVLLQKV